MRGIVRGGAQSAASVVRNAPRALARHPAVRRVLVRAMRRRRKRKKFTSARVSNAISHGKVYTKRPLKKRSYGTRHLPLAMVKAISALDYPAFSKYDATSGKVDNAIGQSGWICFGIGDLTTVRELYENHTGTLGATYLPDPKWTMACSLRQTVDILNGTNVPLYYKAWSIVYTKRKKFNNNSFTDDFTQNFNNPTIGGQTVAPNVASGEAALSVPSVTDLNATPQMARAWKASVKLGAVSTFILKPGESRRLSSNCGEHIFNPAEWNKLASNLALAEHPDSVPYFTCGVLLRVQGTFISQDASAATVSTSAGLTQYVKKIHMRSQLIKKRQTTLSNRNELVGAATITLPKLMGSGGLVGKGGFQDVN